MIFASGACSVARSSGIGGQRLPGGKEVVPAALAVDLPHSRHRRRLHGHSLYVGRSRRWTGCVKPVDHEAAGVDAVVAGAAPVGQGPVNVTRRPERLAGPAEPALGPGVRRGRGEQVELVAHAVARRIGQVSCWGRGAPARTSCPSTRAQAPQISVRFPVRPRAGARLRGGGRRSVDTSVTKC